MTKLETFRDAMNAQSSALVDFTSKIVATPSLSGEEGTVAALIVAEMKRLKYDEVWTDDVGNIIGRIKGSDGPSITLNGHMDVVDPGPVDGWPHDPYRGKVVDGELWGRGSVDMKGPVSTLCHRRIEQACAGCEESHRIFHRQTCQSWRVEFRD